jgi:hypothetical protein
MVDPFLLQNFSGMEAKQLKMSLLHFENLQQNCLPVIKKIFPSF